LLKNITEDKIVYTGTHDNDTTIGWWQNHALPKEKEYFTEYLQVPTMDNPILIVEDLIRALYRSVAILAILPIQDVLKQGSEFRMNIPSTTGGNWLYRIGLGSLTEEKADWLQHLAKVYGRYSEDEEEIDEEATP